MAVCKFSDGFVPEFKFEKINVLPNFLIHITPGNWLHCAVLNEQSYYWRIANSYDVG